MGTILTIVSIVFDLFKWSKESQLTVTKDLEFDLRDIRVCNKFITADGIVSIDTMGILRIMKGWSLDRFTNVPDGALRRDDCTDDIPLISEDGWVPILWRACITHDAMYKILGECANRAVYPFSRKDADKTLRKYMYRNGCILRGTIYYIGVRMFGGFVIKQKQKHISIK